MIDDRRVWSWLIIAVTIGGLLYFLAPVLTPFALSALFAYLGNPLVERLSRGRLSRGTAVAIVFLSMTFAMALMLAILLPALLDQVRSIPGYLDKLHAWYDRVLAPWLQTEFGFSLTTIDAGRVFVSLRSHLDDIGQYAPKLLGGLTASGAAILGWIANSLLIPLITFYLMRDWTMIIERLRELLPRPLEPTITGLAREADAVLGNFLRGQMSVVLALAAIYATGLTLSGLKFGMLIGIVAGLLSFVPYLGPAVGISGGLISAIVSGGEIWTNVGLVLVVFLVGQVIESFFLTPKLVGQSIGLHPVAVIFAVLAGGQLFGFFGVLLALPVTAVILVLLRHAHARYLTSDLYQSIDPGNSPDATARVLDSESQQVGRPAVSETASTSPDSGTRTSPPTAAGAPSAESRP